jgi:hypothetical protein
MQDRPTASELLMDIAALLEDEVVPALEDPLRHHVRVAANLCRIIEREVRLGPAQSAREHAALAALLGTDGSIAELHELLASQLRAGDDDGLAAAAWPVLAAITEDKLAVAKPGHTDHDVAGER